MPEEALGTAGRNFLKCTLEAPEVVRVGVLHRQGVRDRAQLFDHCLFHFAMV